MPVFIRNLHEDPARLDAKMFNSFDFRHAHTPLSAPKELLYQMTFTLLASVSITTDARSIRSIFNGKVKYRFYAIDDLQWDRQGRAW